MGHSGRGRAPPAAEPAYSALDAYVRHLEVAVPPDAVAHIHPHLAEAALEMMERNMDAETAAAQNCPLR